MKTIDMIHDLTFDFVATLLGVDDHYLNLSAEASGGSTTDSLVIKWGVGNRITNMEYLYEGYGIQVGDTIRVYGKRAANSWSTIHWSVMGKG